VDQGRGHGRIDTARQAQDDLFVADLLADFFDGFADVVAHDPVLARAADAQHKALEDGIALLGVRDLGVELHRVEAAIFVGHAGDGAGIGGRHELEAGRHFGDLVAVAHPDVEHALAFGRGVVGDVLEQRRVAAGAHVGGAEFALVAAFDLAAQLVRHGLHAVADAQHRKAQIEDGLRRLVGGFFVNAGVAAGKDHALERAVLGVVADPFVADVAGVDFAEHVGVAHAAGDQLGDL
jgi:hypothetical protein